MLLLSGSLAVPFALGWMPFVTGCKTSQVFRLNPGEEPERFRVVCRDSSRHCARRAKEACAGEYTVLREELSRPELEEVQDSDLSSTGPSEGLVGWRGEWLVVCGRVVPSLELRRPRTASSASATPTEAAPPPPTPTVVHYCVPGATQACLGPGACTGAQACLRDGSGFGVCDCGVRPEPSSPPTSAPSAPQPTAPPRSPQ